MTITLREITEDSLFEICELEVNDNQTTFVAPNVYSLAQALFSKEAWYRGIYHNDTPVGFIMLYDETLREIPPVAPAVEIWRFMIEIEFQGKGYGKRALQLIIKLIEQRACFDAVLLSYVPGNASATKMYESLGFLATGTINEGEIEMKLNLKEDL